MKVLHKKKRRTVASPGHAEEPEPECEALIVLVSPIVQK